MKRSRSTCVHTGCARARGKLEQHSLNTNEECNNENAAFCPMRQQKRPRTERYDLEVKRLGKQQETLDFFQKQLQAVAAAESHTAPSRATLLQTNLSKNLQRQQERFHSFRQEMLDSAQSMMDVKNGVESMQRYVANGSSSAATSLPSLNQGQ